MLPHAFTLLSALALSAARAANVTVASLFLGESVILHAGGGGARVWGGASPNASVRVTLDGAPVGGAVADASGRWEVLLPAQPASWRVVSLSAVDEAGGSGALAALRFGYVMTCSGQSNMALDLGMLANGTAELAAAGAYTGRISLATLLGPRNSQPSWNGSRESPQWNAVSPGVNGTLQSFSGLCFLTGRAILEAINAPVGLIYGAIGGTPIEAWLPDTVLGPMCPVDDPPCGGAADSALYDSLIAPFAPFSLSSILWDQAERDVRCFAPATNRTAQYPCMETALVNTWRSAFKSADSGFAAIQLPSYIGDCSEHGGDFYNCVPGVFNMRLAQEAGLVGVANASAVVTYDLSCPFGIQTPECPIGSVHNLNKTVVAARAARSLLSQLDPAAFPLSGAASPRAASVTAAPTGRGYWLVTVTFDIAPVALRGTQYCTDCCGAGVGDFDASVDGVVWANSTAAQMMSGGNVVFTVPAEVKPTVVRYTGNRPFAQCAVYAPLNGLPAVPFRMVVG